MTSVDTRSQSSVSTDKYGSFDISEKDSINGHKNWFYWDEYGTRKDHFESKMNDAANDFANNIDSYNNCVRAWQRGDSANGSDFDLSGMVEAAGNFSPDEVAQICENAGISNQDFVDSMKMVTMFTALGYSDSDINHMMQSFWASSDAERTSMLGYADGVNVDRTMHDNIKQGDDTYYITTETSFDDDADKKDMQLTAMFLLNSDPDDIQDNTDNGDVSLFDQFIAMDFTGDYASISDDYSENMFADSKISWDSMGAYDKEDAETLVDALWDTKTTVDATPTDVTVASNTNARDIISSTALSQAIQENGLPDTDDAIEAMIAENCDTWDNVSDGDKTAVVAWLKAANEDGNTIDENMNIIHQVGVDEDGEPVFELVAAAPGFDSMQNGGLSSLDALTLASLMFYVLMQRMDNQEDLIRNYGDTTDSKNGLLADANSFHDFLANLKASADGGDIDATDGTVTMSDGTEMGFEEFVSSFDIELPDDCDLDSMSDTVCEAVMGSVSSFADKCSTDANTSVQTLNEATSRYQTTSQLLSNFLKSDASLRSMLSSNMPT